MRDPANAFATLATYTYDAFGRRVKKVTPTKTIVSFYDTDGHLIQEVEKKDAAADLARSYVYLEDELLGVVDAVKEVGTASLWSALAMRLPKVPPPGWGVFVVFLGSGTLLLLLARRHPAGASAAAGAALATFVCAGTPRPPPTFRWAHVDPLGTPLAVTNTPGNAATTAVVWRGRYEPFGRATVQEDPDGDGAAFTFNVRFPGQREDAETGWYDNFFRTYDPTVGRYVEADPIGQLGGINVYEYADGNPTNAVDPYGLYSSLQVQLAIGNFLTGVADAASLGLGPLAREALAPYGWGGYVDPCSTAYDAGGWASLGLGVGRLGYAAAAKGVSRFASSGVVASAGRITLKRLFRGGLPASSLLKKYGSHDALRAAAGRTNPWWNAAAANGALGSAVNCGCDKTGGSGNGGQGAAGGNGGNDLAGQFLGGLGALNRR